jgi:hypothetical protein
MELRFRLHHTAQHLPNRFTTDQRFPGLSHETRLRVVQSHDRVEITGVEELLEKPAANPQAYALMLWTLVVMPFPIAQDQVVNWRGKSPTVVSVGQLIRGFFEPSRRSVWPYCSSFKARVVST